MIPSVPSNSNYHFLMLAFGAIIVYLSLSQITEVRTEFQKDDIKFEEILFLDSIFNYKVKMRRVFLDSILSDNNSYYSKLNSEEKDIAEKIYNEAADKIISEEEILFYNKDWISNELELIRFKKNIKSFEEKRDDSFFLFLFGIVFILVGGISLYRNQRTKEKILEAEWHNVEIKNYNCQSCGMYLENDNVETKTNYCSFCHDGKDFKHDFSLETFKDIIGKRLDELGYSKRNKSKYLKKLKSLGRWRQKMHWEGFSINEIEENDKET